MVSENDSKKLTGFFGYFLTSFRVTLLLIIGLALFGGFTMLSLPREATPEIDVPVAIVVTVYPGASARDVEELVTEQVEDEILLLEGLRRVDSSSSLGISIVTVEFSADEDLEDALRRLREAIDKITDLPTEAELPSVIEASISDQPIVSLSLSGIEDERLLTLFGEELADELENLAGISQVDVVGARNVEVSVVVDPTALADKGLTIGRLLGVIQAANINVPFGQLETDGFNYDLRVVGRFKDVGDVASLSVALPSGEVVTLSELGKVELVLADRSSFSRSSVAGGESTNAVTLSIRKKTGVAVTTVIDNVLETVDVFKNDRLPEGVEVVEFANQADDIREQLSNVTRSGLQTLVIVFSLLWLFLGWRSAIIASLAVPLTFSISFIVFNAADISLNNISLFSLILSLGLLVDTAIVVVEGVHRYKDAPYDGMLAGAYDIIHRFKKPLIGGTLTTVAAFFPMLLVSGIIGQFLGVIPIVVTATLVSSLIVALVFIPAVAVQLFSRWKQVGASERWFDRVFARFRAQYDLFMDRALANRRTQWMFFGILGLLLVVGLSLPFTGILRTGLFPAADLDFMIVNLELPPGSRLEETTVVVDQVEDNLKTIPDINSYVANIGSSTSLEIGGSSSSGNESLASFFINLDTERDRSSLEIADELRGHFKSITNANVVVEEASSGPPSSSPVEMRLIGDDLVVLDELSLEIMGDLAGIEGAINVDRNLRNSAGEFNFVFNREALAATGLSATQVAQSLRASVFGIEATTFLNTQGDEVSVELKVRDESVAGVNDVLALPLLTPRGERVLFGQVAKVDLQSSVNTVRRRDGNRAVAITASVSEGANANEVSGTLNEMMLERALPDGFRFEFGGEQQETADTFNELYQSMGIAVILILLILVVEFDSFLQPMVIFLSIPLALIGVLFGLVITRGQLNFASFIGLVSLTGIVVNNAILLVDRMNQNMKTGTSALRSVREATSSRLRPIILTTITTAAGVAPLIWVDAFFRDMALTLITGLLFSSVLTLVLIPILYLRLQDWQTKRQLKRAH